MLAVSAIVARTHAVTPRPFPARRALGEASELLHEIVNLTGPGRANRERGDDRFVTSLFLAAALHVAIILGVTFSFPKAIKLPQSSLDVILVPPSRSAPPEEAEFLAQENRDGGGEANRVERPAAPLPSPLTKPVPDVVAASPPRSEPVPPTSRPIAVEHQPSPPATTAVPVVSRVEASHPEVHTLPPRPRPRPPDLRSTPAPATPAAPHPDIDAATLITDSLAYATLNAELAQRLDAYARKPKQKWITARTRESKYAAYMDAWRQKVERIGNLNYPEAARRKRLTGTLLLDVALNADGSVRDVILRRSSGHRILDDASIRIVRLAAPFSPFPPGIRKDTDVLHIERTWQFLATNRLRSR